MTIVDRQTRCFLGMRAVMQRRQEIGQQMVNAAPAAQYYSRFTQIVGEPMSVIWQ